MSKEQGIDYFGRNLPFTKLHIQASLKVRRQIYEWFRNQIGGVSDKVFLEHGSTPDTIREDSNCFIKWLIEDGAKVYATSPEDITHIEQIFPGIEVIPWPPSKFSFDKLDYIISSAVIEHVGSKRSQVEYVSNLLQLHENILLTTPNRYHWLEFHTKIPFLHWLPKRWHRAVLSVLGMKFWAREENLHLLSKQDLKKIISTAVHTDNTQIYTSWYQPKFLGMVSNLVVLVKGFEK